MYRILIDQEINKENADKDRSEGQTRYKEINTGVFSEFSNSTGDNNMCRDVLVRHIHAKSFLLHFLGGLQTMSHYFL